MEPVLVGGLPVSSKSFRAAAISAGSERSMRELTRGFPRNGGEHRESIS
jgi:hypothetical protein